MEDEMKKLFTTTLVVEAIFGLGFLTIPGFMFGTFGVTPNEFAISLARMFGSALLGFVVLLWKGRGSDNQELKEAKLASMFIYWLLSTLLLLLTQLSGIFNIMGWGVVVLHFGFLIAYGTALFKK